MVKNEPPSELNSTQKTSTELIRFNQNHEIQYQGYCKLKINRLSNSILVEPLNENFVDIIGFTASFNWKFIKQKNILFGFGEFDYQDFALVLSEEKICRIVYSGIYKDRSKDFVTRKIFVKRFLKPIFKKVAQNKCSRLNEIIEEWIKNHDGKEKDKYLQLLKWYRENPEMDFVDDVKNVLKVEIEGESKRSLKRRFREIGNAIGTHLSDPKNGEGGELVNSVNGANFDNVPKQKLSKRCTKIIDISCFKLVNFKKSRHLRQKLLIFTSPERIKCYEYAIHYSKKCFFHKCKINGKRYQAFLDFDKNGNEFVKLENVSHSCTPIKYLQEKYIEMKVLKKPDYEIFENSGATFSKLLVIFDSIDRNRCHEYFWSSSSKRFQCRGCGLNGKHFAAQIYYESSENEYVQILGNQHACELRKYNPKKYSESHQIVLTPNFEVQTFMKHLTKRNRLIIFDENDRKKCYSYFYNTPNKIYYCNGCRQKHAQTSARISQNSDGEDYVILSNSEHVCVLRDYIPQKRIPKEVILRQPKFKFMEGTGKFKSKLFIFDSNDATLCHTFSNVYKESSRTLNIDVQRYACLECRKYSEKGKPSFTVELCKDSDGGEMYVKMMDSESHKCQPKKFEPEKYETKTEILKSKIDYVLFRKNDESDALDLIIYHPEDKSLCYKFRYKENVKHFLCYRCKGKSNFVTAKIHQNSDGSEYLIPSQRAHVCEPVKISTFLKPDSVILEKSGLTFDVPAKIDESKIIRLPNFELQPNRNGTLDRKLLIFIDEKKELCYDYGFNQFADNFHCKKCYITANLHIDEENGNEKYIILGDSEHKCTPIKYTAKKEIIESTNFLIFNREDESKPTKLILFTSAAKNLCYEYTFYQRAKNFRCCSCKALNKSISAKLLTVENGDERIQLLNSQHLCTPKKFDLKKFQPTTTSKQTSRNNFFKRSASKKADTNKG